jgi:hypothetical protein
VVMEKQADGKMNMKVTEQEFVPHGEVCHRTTVCALS